MEPIDPRNAVLAIGLRKLYEKSQFCDVAFIVCGERFLAHKAVLAAMSSNFQKYLHDIANRPVSSSAEEASDPMNGMLLSATAAQVNCLGNMPLTRTEHALSIE